MSQKSSKLKLGKEERSPNTQPRLGGDTMAQLTMDPKDAQKVVRSIMYRKRVATRDEIEESFRRSVDSAGLSVDKILDTVLSKMKEHGNLKRARGRNGIYEFKHGTLS